MFLEKPPRQEGAPLRPHLFGIDRFGLAEGHNQGGQRHTLETVDLGRQSPVLDDKMRGWRPAPGDETAAQRQEDDPALLPLAPITSSIGNLVLTKAL